MELKKTPLYQKHIDNKGKIVDFGGWALPVEYESMLKEAKAVRTSCGVFDASHMGEIRVTGSNALNFLQKIVSNDISKTKPGQMQYNLLPNKDGGVIDDLMVYNCGNSFLCVVNASNSEKDYNWIKSNQIDGVQIIDESNNTALIAIQGPNAVKLLESVLEAKLADIKYMHFKEGNFLGKKMLISRSGYTGEDGFEVYLANNDTILLWDRLIEEGKEFGLTLCGLGSRDILRIEAGYPLYGHEINDTINPTEACLDWAVKLSKDFIGKEKIEKAKQEGTSRKRVGFIMEERAIARQGYSIYSPEDKKVIGQICSGTYSPNLDKFIGMAYVEKDFSKNSTPIEIKIRDKFYKAKVCDFSFIKR